MQPRHAAGVTIILAVAVFLGAFAGFRSAALSSKAQGATVRKAHAASATIAARGRRLDRVQTSLLRLLRTRPPRLPKVPHFAPVPTPPAHTPAPAMVAAAPVQAAPATVTPAPQRVVYARPRRVIIIHKHHGDDGGGGGGDD
jgi:hypothetical protein